MARNVPAILRDIEARNAAMRTYAVAFDRFAEREQTHRLSENLAASEGAHQYAIWCMRAYRAETDDPEPRPAFRYDPHDR